MKNETKDKWIETTLNKVDAISIAKAEIARMVIESENVADFGCGSGQISKILSKNKKIVYAIDKEDDFTMNVNKYPNIKIIKNDIETALAFKIKADAAILFDVLEHIDKNKRLKILKHIRNSGFKEILISVPAHMILWTEHDKKENHKLRYEKKEIINELKTANWNIQWVKNWNLLLLPIKVILKNKTHEAVKSVPDFLNKLISKMLIIDFKINKLYGLSYIVYAKRD